MPSPSLIEYRREQLFPVLSPAQIAVARRFGGSPVPFERDTLVFGLGQADTPAYLVLSGSIVAASTEHHRFAASVISR